MKVMRGKFGKGWIGLILASVVMLGCGGGGGGDAGGGTPAPAVPDTVNFRVGLPGDAALLSAVVAIQGNNATVDLLDIMLPGIDGTFNRLTEQMTLNPAFFAFATSIYPTYTQIRVDIVEPIALQAGNNPTAGKLDVVITTVDPDPKYYVMLFSPAGIEIRTHNQPGDADPIETVFFTWQQFDALDVTAPANHIFAQFSYGMWTFLLEQVGVAFDALTKINENDGALAAGSATISGTPPPNQPGGNIVITWTDASANGEVGPGDNFVLAYNNWWVDDPADNIDDLFNGLVSLPGYIENERGPIGGNFLFTDFKKQETVDGVIQADFSVTVNGGFSLVVSW